MNELLLSELVLGLKDSSDLKLELSISKDQEKFTEKLFNFVHLDEDDYFLDTSELLIELKNMGIELPSANAAKYILLYDLLSKLVKDENNTPTLAKHIWLNYIQENLVPTELNMNEFSHLVSEYDDFSQEGNIEFYGKKECEKKLANIISDLKSISKDLLNSIDKR